MPDERTERTERERAGTVGLVEEKEIPFSVRFFAWLYILSAAYGVLESVLSLARGEIDFSLGIVMNLLVGIGLLRWSEAARRWALFEGGLGMAMMPFMVVLFLLGPKEMDCHFPGGKVVVLPKEALLVLLLLGFTAFYAQHRLLTRPAIRRLFERPRAAPADEDDRPAGPEGSAED